MGFLRIADTASTKQYDHTDSDGVVDGSITVRAAVDKRLMNAVITGMPDEMIARQMRDEDLGDDAVFVVKQSPIVSQALFTALVTGWSLESAPTVANYLALEVEPASWIDGVLYGHWNELNVSRTEVGKPSTSPRGSRKDIRAKA